MMSAEKEWDRSTTLGALCAVSMLKGADLQLLPASFRAMEVTLNLRPSALGGLALAQGVACAICGPFWGNLVDSGVSRKALLTVGAGMWGTCTLLLAFASRFVTMAILRALNGMALAMLLPVVQSFVVDLAPKSERGYIFGRIFFFSNLGQVIACLFVTPISNQEIYGTSGWRFALAVVGVMSWSVMLLVPLLVVEEPRAWRPDRFGIRKEFQKLMQFLTIPTFGVIILQGVFGTIPGAAQSFTTMYLQYCGFSDALCALMNSLRIIGDACGGVLGGYIGDFLSTRTPRFGRPLTAQISLLASVPMVYFVFMRPPLTPIGHEVAMGAMAGFLFTHGLMGSWTAPGCICPIMCDIVPRRNLASAYAWELALVFCSGNTLGPMLVGYLSQGYFGYHMSTNEVGAPGVREQNAIALGKAVFVSSVLPYLACALFFSLMYITYNLDVQQAAQSDISCGEAVEGKGELVPLKASIGPVPAA